MEAASQHQGKHLQSKQALGPFALAAVQLLM
jgi:hypothetical protein